jgi:hypothetical protein
VQRPAMQSNSLRSDILTDRTLVSTDSKTSHHEAKFTPASDSRNRRVSGLYLRNGRYYAQLWVERGIGTKGPKRFPLVDGDNLPIRNLQAAKESVSRPPAADSSDPP